VRRSRLRSLAAPLSTAALSLSLALAAPSAAQAHAPGRSPAPARGHAPAACSPYVGITGFSDQLDKTSVAGTPVSELSGFAHDTDGRLLAVGDSSYLYTLDPRTDDVLSAQPLAHRDGTILDSEAVAVNADGTRLVTDETAPSVSLFSRSGRELGALPVPDALKVAPAGRATHNLTFEGLALLPDGRTLVASMEGALTGDAPDLRRFQTWQRIGRSDAFRLGPQYAFRTDPGLDVSDITSTGDGRLLVLERTYTSGVGNTVHLVLADPRGATDVAGVDVLTHGQRGVRPVAARTIADIGACPSLGATAKQPQPNPLLDNIEGVTVDGRGPAGTLRVLLVSDDNANPVQTTRLYRLTARLPR
jgi:hypothetical protein